MQVKSAVHTEEDKKSLEQTKAELKIPDPSEEKVSLILSGEKVEEEEEETEEDAD